MLKARAARPSLFFSSTLLGFRTLKIKIQRSVFKVGPRLGPNWTGTRTLHGRKACFFITSMNEDRGTRAAFGCIFSFLIKTHTKANKYSYKKHQHPICIFTSWDFLCVSSMWKHHTLGGHFIKMFRNSQFSYILIHFRDSNKNYSKNLIF